MRSGGPALRRADREPWTKVGAGAGAVVVAILLWTRFSIYGDFSRDEGIYAYGGQRMSHGVAPYASIFDPKGPGATILCGLGAGLAHLLGRNDLLMMRVVFFVVALLTVVAVYLFALELWQSVGGALIASVVFASFAGWARDALVGPDAKMPGVLFAVLAMWLGLRRQWFWAAAAGSLAVIVWQPLGLYPLMVIIAAVLHTPGRRWRALGMSIAGFVLPIIAVAAYFASASAFGKLVEAAVVFPIKGYHGGGAPLFNQLKLIEFIVHHYYGVVGAVLLYVGLVLIVILPIRAVYEAHNGWRGGVIDPLVLIVLVTLIGQFVFMIGDFHNYPRVYPLLPYAAAGVAGGAVRAWRRWADPALLRTTASVAAVAAVALVGWSWVTFGNSSANNHKLHAEQATACAVNRLVVPGTTLYALGNPAVLVLTHRVNPDRFIYLNSGVDAWKVSHTKGGFDGWTRQIAQANPSVIVVGGWEGKYRKLMKLWLKGAGYHRAFVGRWVVFLSPAARVRAQTGEIHITVFPTDWPLTSSFKKFTNRTCARTA